MTYQKVTGSLMANSHPGSYCGQDAYNDMFVTEIADGIFDASNRRIQVDGTSIRSETEGLQGCDRFNYRGWYCDGNSSKTAYSNGVFKTSGLS